MSDTAPKHQDALIAGHHPAPERAQRPRDLVWRLAKNDRTATCEMLNDEGVGAGWEVRVKERDEFLCRRCLNEAHARAVADGLRQDYLRAGWTSVCEDPQGS